MSAHKSDPAVLWVMTPNRDRLKNMWITCPNCGGREYVASLPVTVLEGGGRRAYQPDQEHVCPKCRKAYGPLEVANG